MSKEDNLLCLLMCCWVSYFTQPIKVDNGTDFMAGFADETYQTLKKLARP